MQPLTLEWIDKAEGDLATATREYRAQGPQLRLGLLPCATVCREVPQGSSSGGKYTVSTNA